MQISEDFLKKMDEEKKRENEKRKMEKENRKNGMMEKEKI